MKIKKYIPHLLTLIIILIMSFPQVARAASENIDNPETVENELMPPQVFAYTGNYQTVTLEPGIYRMEAWGAKGGGACGDGKLFDISRPGGYSSGELELLEPTTLHVYVGGGGANASGAWRRAAAAGGWNGGGRGGVDLDDDSAGGGGGASDIRLVAGAWNDLASLRSRIMVAGGAAGVMFSVPGGAGGGLSGETGDGNTTGGGGKQTSGYAFGIGQAGRDYIVSGGYPTPGAGGGYYGGFSGIANAINNSSGGSGFVSGHPGCDAVDESGVHTGQPDHYSGLSFTDTVMETGVNSGAKNGKVVITQLSSEPAVKYQVTVITRYEDDVLPEASQSYQVREGARFEEPFEMLDGYSLGGVQLFSLPDYAVDTINKLVSIETVDQDYTITLDFVRREYQVELNTRYIDDHLPETSQTFWVYHNDPFTQTYEIAEGYQIANLDRLPQGIVVDQEARTVAFERIVQDTYIDLEFEAVHNVTLILRYLDGALPEQTSTYLIPNGKSFQEGFELLAGYELKNSLLRIEPDFEVDMIAQTVRLDPVLRDHVIELEFDKKEYRIDLTTVYLDNSTPEDTQTYWSIHGEDFSQTYQVAEGYQVANADQLPAGVIIDLENNTVTIDNVTNDYDIVLELEKKQFNVVINIIYEDGVYDNQSTTYNVAYGDSFATDFAIQRGYIISKVNFNASGISVNSSRKTISINRVTGPVEITIRVSK
ncbi:MAG: hypothetical protein LBV33_00390 [Lachnospiraceae bacterium]|jgi:hypothetical protein|nr:hypothetical protein [Lachnospiraceae bacterium]